MDKRSLPFHPHHQLNEDLDHVTLQDPACEDVPLPGHSRVKIHDTSRLNSFLEREFHSKDLQELAEHLWLMSTQSSSNISPLHRQKVKGRRIIISEDPRLHLVWIEDRIFIKPLPTYLLSHSFWSIFLLSSTSPIEEEQRDCIAKAALGYLRTYYHLIKHESDLHIAHKERLIPGSISWERFCHFSDGFENISDDMVSGRYKYGELRLSRLNFYAKIFLHKSFQRVHTQYGAYFARFYAPILFVFGALTIGLSAMQLEMAVEQVSAAAVHGPLMNFWYFSRLFSVGSLFILATTTLMLISLFMYKFVKEWKYAITDRLNKKHVHSQHKKAEASTIVAPKMQGAQNV